MPPKRKTLTRSVAPLENEEPAPQRPRRLPTSLKDKILAIVSDSESLISAIRIKKLLIADYGVSDTKASNTKVNTLLKSMSADRNLAFGCIGNSYHSGMGSTAYINYNMKQTAENELKEHSRKMEILCPYCETWNDQRCFVREDSVARGGLHKCLNEDCNKNFYSWISDGYLFGHKIEYRYGDGMDDYKDLNEGKE